MNKKNVIIIIVIIIVVALAILGVIKLFSSKTKDSESDIKVYPLSDINISDSSANLIFAKNIDSTNQQEELHVSEGFEYIFNSAGSQHSVKVVELTDDYITLSLNSKEGLAPTMNSGGFGLIDRYDELTIKKNTGIHLNVQVTDNFDGGVYFFYVSH